MRRDMKMASRFGMNDGSIAASAKGKRARPCPPEKVRVPRGMTVAEAVRVRGQDAVWAEVVDGAVELWFPGRAGVA